jgi:antitoxin component of MazEF toxin-antitoxin module
MTITTIQKVINIGSSKGVTIPAKDLKRAGIKPGDEVEISVKKPQGVAQDAEVLHAAKDLLKRYDKDFKNLANR